MDAMKKAIMKRRMMLAGDMEDMKDADMNPGEGSMDDLDIAEEKQGMSEDGLAPDVMAGAQPDNGDMKIEIENESESPMQGDEMERIKSFFTEDDVGKPGIKGKVAAKMMAALNKLKS